MDSQIPEPMGSLGRVLVDPTVDYRPVIFWIWNGDMSEERICFQLEDIADRGFGGVVLHPMGERFRLNDFLRGMSPPYLSEAFFDLVKAAVRHASSLGMRVWLYDEGGWPSGSAQGLVVDGHPELRARVLRCRRVDPFELGACREGVIALCAITGAGTVTVAKSPSSLPPDTQHLLSFEEQVAGDGYPDLMNPKAVDRFIELTHERYALAVGQYFGTVIPGMFTDEPRVRGTIAGTEAPWSPALASRLGATSCPDWRLWLPALFGPEALGFDPFAVLGEAAVVEARCGYCEAVAAQFQESYWLRLNHWCEEHDLIHTGHVGGEDNLPDHVGGGFFHWFRTAGCLHAPGVDVIWRQLAQGQRNFSFPQFAASALHTRPEGAGPPADPTRQGLTVSESYAVYGYGATFQQYAWVANFQAVRGVNRVWPMAYYSSTSEGQAYGTMSHLGPGNPLWPHWRAFSSYLARLGVVISHTGHACDLAVYYPIEAEWAYRGRDEAAQAWESFRSCCECLHEVQMPFDVLDNATLAASSAGEGFLETNGQFYSTVLVPNCTVIPVAVAEKLRELHETGGRVVFLGEPPHIATVAGEQAQLEEALSALVGQAFCLDERSEREQWGTASGRASEAVVGSVMDGMTAALLGPAGLEIYAPHSLRPDAVILAPQEEWPRMAQLMAVAVGRYVLEPLEPTPELRVSSRWLDDRTWLHLLFNEGGEDLRTRLAVVFEEPLLVERWNLLTGECRAVVRHETPSEPTSFEVRLSPGEATVLVSRVLHEGDASPGRSPKPLVLARFEEAERVIIASECLLEGGTMRLVDQFSPVEETRLLPWREAGLEHFSGTVRYHFVLPVAAEYVASELVLDLGRVEYAASVFANGQWVGDALWQPYRLPLTGVLEPGHNELVIEVSNTLAPQILLPENRQEAVEHAWDNPYYRRTIEWHRETLGGGLLGPVSLLALLS